MADLDPYAPAKLVETFLHAIEHSILPLTKVGVESGNKVFGAAILRKDDLSLVLGATNFETSSPLLHGEVNCIQQFYAMPQSARPDPKECLFLATHEPCSLCLSAITWSGFDNFYYLFSYENTRDSFSIPHDIHILEEVYKVRSATDTDETFAARPLYNRSNAFFTGHSISDLLDGVEDTAQKEGFRRRIQAIQERYDELSGVYQGGKGGASIPLS